MINKQRKNADLKKNKQGIKQKQENSYYKIRTLKYTSYNIKN